MSHRVNAPLQFRKMSVRNELSDLEIEDFFGSLRELLQSWTKIIVHLKYEDIDSIPPGFKDIDYLLPPFNVAHDLGEC